MVLEQELTLAQLEELYQILQTDGETKISPSEKYEFAHAFGLEAAIIQFIATWHRNNKNRTVVFDCQSIDYPDYIRKACAHPSNIAACYFGEIFTNFSNEEFTYSKPAVLNLISPILNKMWREDLSEKKTTSDLALLCFSSHPYEYLPCFYELPLQGNIRSKDQFNFLVEKILENKKPTFTSTLNKDEFTSSLGSLLHELIKNTDEHSVTDEEGNLYSKGVRGIIVKYATLNRGALLKEYSGNNPRLTTYFNQLLGRAGRTTTKLTFLEVSVIDTGPGLARRWLSNKSSEPPRKLGEISIEEERLAVIKCFQKYMTTKVSESSGMGLTAVLEHLYKLKAFLRLRTGRLSLFQANENENEKQKFTPLDWNKNQPALPEVSGTTFTICFPISIEGETN